MKEWKCKMKNMEIGKNEQIQMQIQLENETCKINWKCNNGNEKMGNGKLGNTKWKNARMEMDNEIWKMKIGNWKWEMKNVSMEQWTMEHEITK